MNTEKELELKFKNAAGQSRTITVKNPKDGLTKEEVDTAMNAIVAANVFTSNGGDLVEAVEGRVRTTTLDILA
ncbi:MAG: DUF2922 domain-containing protein [Acidaminococcaceae bacterium]|nr:DUF2922 domain-containing protein [Acidaminococcaceae bacterium]MBR1590841.1 DUF2922 domain-containing protein [Acidaminococcaceae bacterium]